jgi:hypothetical protein
MEGLAQGGPGALGKNLLDLLFSPVGRIALIFIAVTLVLWLFRPRRRGRKPARDLPWILERLKNEKFEKWIYVDLLIYLALGGAFGLAAFYALGGLSDLLAPTGYDYLFRPDPDWIMMPAIFLGISLPGFLWLPVGRLIHGKRFAKYVLYMIARQKADTRPFIKWGCTPIAVLCVVFAVQMSRAHIGLVRDGAAVWLVQQGAFRVQPVRYPIGEVSAIYLVQRRYAPNGNIVDRPHILLSLTRGRVWSSVWSIGSPKSERLAELARQLSHHTGLPIHPRTLLSEDDLKKKMRESRVPPASTN